MFQNSSNDSGFMTTLDNEPLRTSKNPSLQETSFSNPFLNTGASGQPQVKTTHELHVSCLQPCLKPQSTSPDKVMVNLNSGGKPHLKADFRVLFVKMNSGGKPHLKADFRVLFVKNAMNPPLQRISLTAQICISNHSASNGTSLLPFNSRPMGRDTAIKLFKA